MQAVIFDWDGTLVDTLGGLYRANVAVMTAFDLPFDVERYRRHYSPDWRVMYRRLGIPDGRLDEANALWHRAVREADVGRPFEGVATALRRLREAGMRLGLVTAGDRALVAPRLERDGLGTLLEARAYGDTLAVRKPDPAPLRLVLDELGVEPTPETVAYLGDAPDDMRMARAVGVRAVGIASIVGHPAELESAGADEIAGSVVAWVDRLLSRDPSPAR